MHPFRTVACLSLLAAADLAAQTWTFPLNPRATYLRTNSDAPQPPLVLDLGALGIAPGQWVRVGSSGGFRYVNGGGDNHRSLCAVFSASATLLATNVQQRVVDAIAAGPAFASANTYFGNLPMDVPQDFFCSRQGWADAIDVRVPAGATHLFIGVHDSLYNDNVDPNGDHAAVVTLLAAPTLPGTGEHITLKSAVSGVPAQAPDLHVAPPGSTTTVEIGYPLGFVDGSIYAFVADVIATGAAPLQPIPGWWTPNLIWLQFGVLPSSPDWSATWSIVATADFPGTTVIVQAVALTEQARNGLFEATAAHAFAWQ